MEDLEKIRLPWSDWKIVKYLGGGAYGKVYEIERNISGVQEKAALKIVSRPKDDSEIETYYDEGYDKASIAASYDREIQNYVQEYTLMKKLQGQTNIVSCDDFTVVPHENGIGGDVFIRMELLTSLQQILRQRMLSVQEIIKLGKDISNALILCEKKDIIHRDIKPANIMVSEFGDYELGDFGVSKIMSHTTYATVMGTPEYEAPEVVRIEKYGKTADIYSLGITLYWLLNERKMPFIDADEELTSELRSNAMKRRCSGEKLPAPKNGSEELRQIVLKACEYRPENRYASARELYDALDALGNEEPTVDPVPVEKPANTDDKGKGSITGGSNGACEPESDWNGGGRTQGNSWGRTGETIGKPGGPSGQNNDKGHLEMTDPGITIGVKDAYKKQQKKEEEAKKVAAEKKAEEKKEVTAQIYQKRIKKTVVWYIWDSFVIGCCVVGLFVGMQDKGMYAITAMIFILAVLIEMKDLFIEEVRKKDVFGHMFSTNFCILVGGVIEWAMWPTDNNGYLKSWQANIIGIALLIWLFVVPIIVERFSIVEINEPVEKSDNKSKIEKYKQIKIVVIIVVTAICGLLIAKNLL